MLLIEQKVELLRLSLDSQGVDPKDSKSANHSVCAAMFTAVLFKIPRKWSQPSHPSADEQRKRGTFTQGHFIPPKRKMKSGHSQEKQIKLEIISKVN